MKKTRIFSTMLATVICMASLPAINVFAANQQRTTTLDLTVAGFQNDQKNEDEGWSWDAATSTLTLDNVDFSTAKKSCVIVDGEKVTNIVFSGDNKMTSGTTVISRKGSAKDTGVVLSGKTKDSVLNLEETGNLPVMDQPNVTFESGTVNAKGGAVITLYSIKVMDATLNIDTSEVADGGWNDGLYANGSVEIYGGDVNINAGRAGILVVGIGAPEPKTGLIIKDGKVDINAKLADIYLGTDNIKNGLISGGDITLGGDIGIFLNDCEKCEIKGGTFHTDECEKPFAVHRDSSAVFEYAKADYTELDKAEEAAKALNKDNYVDFTAVEKALEAIDRTKNLTQQSDVDKMAKDINDAVEALVYKSADYTELDKAEKAAKALAAIDRTKNITEQADVDAMVKAINDAVASLVKKAPASSQPDSVSSSDASSDTSSSASDSSASDSSSSDSSSSDSKSDSSSKAASNASNTNPSTGVAGGAFALALLSGAAVVMAKKKK